MISVIYTFTDWITEFENHVNLVKKNLNTVT